VSGQRKNTTPIVSREYRAEPDACARALRILLDQPLVVKMAAKHSQPGGPDNAEDLENDRIAVARIISE
jgi:hypothetical protein